MKTVFIGDRLDVLREHNKSHSATSGFELQDPLKCLLDEWLVLYKWLHPLANSRGIGLASATTKSSVHSTAASDGREFLSNKICTIITNGFS